SSLYEFNIITGEKNIISEPNTQYIIDPNGENLIYIRTSYINENVSNLGVINLKNREKIEKSFKEYRLNGFIKDSKHLIISSFPSKEKDYNSSIYLLDLNTLNLKEIFVP
ncbi:MAG: hypothetical protein H5U37_03250, partial [Caldisericia bacterium]|nr:hypothetical protein [Caldisericia bacterium]